MFICLESPLQELKTINFMSWKSNNYVTAYLLLYILTEFNSYCISIEKDNDKFYFAAESSEISLLDHN